MTITEINEQIDKAMARQKSFQTNRTLSGLVCVFLVYNIYKAVKDESPALWFFIVMGLFIAVAVFLVVFDTKRINQAKAELEELKAAKEAAEADLERLTDEDEEADEEPEDSADESGGGGESDEDDQQTSDDSDEPDEADKE